MSVNCPYNPAHIMPPDSFLRHLSRCTATNKKQFSQCKYNQLHVYRKEAIQQHEKSTLVCIQSVLIAKLTNLYGLLNKSSYGNRNPNRVWRIGMRKISLKQQLRNNQIEAIDQTKTNNHRSIKKNGNLNRTNNNSQRSRRGKIQT